MNYQLKDGVVEDEHYGTIERAVQLTKGIRLAKLSTLPESVLNRATQVSEALTACARQRHRTSNTRILGERRRLILQLQETLKQAAEGNMDDESMARWLSRVQARFVEELASVT
jgi:DNA mismatch repair protein MSH4